MSDIPQGPPTIEEVDVLIDVTRGQIKFQSNSNPTFAGPDLRYVRSLQVKLFVLEWFKREHFGEVSRDADGPVWSAEEMKPGRSAQ